MRAVRFHAAKDVRVEDVPAPSGELGPTEVLISSRLCGICGTDLHEFVDGPHVIPAEPHPLNGSRAPQILGHELSGDVEAVGTAVTSVRPGDRVSIMPLAFCGDCWFCRRGLGQLCPRNACFGLSAAWGGFARQAVLEGCQVSLLPDGVSYEQGALIEPAAVAVTTVERGGVRPGDIVLVTGSGPIGALTVLAARAAGAGQVFLSEPNAKRAARAASLGVDAVLDPTATDVVAELRERTGGRGVDAALECSGNEQALRACLEAVRARGAVAQVGLHGRDAAIDVMAMTRREVTLTGVWGYSVHDWPRISAQVESGSFPVERVVTSTIGLEEIVELGFEPLADPASDEIKVLVQSR